MQKKSLSKQKEESFDLLRAGLLVAKLDEQDLDVDAYVRVVHDMAESVREGLKKDATEQERLAALATAHPGGTARSARGLRCLRRGGSARSRRRWIRSGRR